ncbi:hypothetical protein Taro_031814 [Colocasia esculenta]|uniref:Transducin beta-like protein 2 n=1 Tax=Colocasia esculenta TaxID=4460 RepID=A0A843VJS5_COLES|nr:hypothetical protein [Colocasia esculenta]
MSAASASLMGFSYFSVPVLSAVVGAVLVLLFFSDYFRRRRAEVASIAPPLEPKPADQKPPKNSSSSHSHKKLHARSHAHAPDKVDQNKRHHPLDVNTLKGHTDSVTAVCFSSDGRNLATACGDGAVRVFKLDDVSNKSFKLLRINMPAGAHPTAITFSEGASSVVVAGQALSGSSLYMYADVSSKPSGDGNQQVKPTFPEIKWEHHKVHDQRTILTLFGATASYGTADGSTIIASCSEGTDIKLWHGKSGKNLGTIWEIVYAKDGSVKEVSKVMQLKGHKSAVTWLCFSPNSEQIITSSKDGTMRVWNINVRYHLDEDPKTLKVFQIPLHDAGGSALHYGRMSLSPDGKILAATHGSTLQWLCAETGKVLDTADNSHEGEITGIAWSPQMIAVGGGLALVLATAGADKKVKLWLAPQLNSS